MSSGRGTRRDGKPLVVGQQEARQEGVSSEAILKRAVHAFDAALGLA